MVLFSAGKESSVGCNIERILENHKVFHAALNRIKTCIEKRRRIIDLKDTMILNKPYLSVWRIDEPGNFRISAKGCFVVYGKDFTVSSGNI